MDKSFGNAFVWTMTGIGFSVVALVLWPMAAFAVIAYSLAITHLNR